MNELKIGNMKMPNAVNAPANAFKIEDKAEDTLKDTAEQTTEQTEKAIVKHVIAYLGNSLYTDSTGRKWKKNDEYTYSDDEYEGRADLHFMVKYGEMKHTVVTM